MALDAAMREDPASLQHALQKSLDSKESQRCARALARSADEACRVSRHGFRPERLAAPSTSLSPLP